MKKYYIESLGCPKNLVDSEIFAWLTEKNGYEFTENPMEAELIIVNTCGFISDAKEEAIETIFEMNALKTIGKCKKLIATGCLIGRYFEDLKSSLPEVDHLVDLKDFKSFAKILGDNNPQLERKILTPPHYAFLRISDGCDNRCTYCAIPGIRGGHVSRPIEELVKESEKIAKQGVKELIVTAQDVTLYGQDIYGEKKLPALLIELEKIEGLKWIRLLYMHPAHVTEELIDMIAGSKKVLPYFDIPLQHASDKMLKSMNRKISSQAQVNVLTMIRNKIPHAAIRTTFISGFPGEKQKDHLELLELIRKVKFERLGVFVYSPEEGTPASDFPNKVTINTAQKRQDEIMATQQAISEEIMVTYVGQELEAIIDAMSEGEGILYDARTIYDAPDIDGNLFIVSGSASVGDIVKVRIIDSWEYDLIGEIVYDRD